MLNFVSRFQKDLGKLQATLQKEGNDLLEKVKHLELVDSLEEKKRELEKLFHKKMKKFEPAYIQFLEELRKNAKKAGIDIEKIEKDIKGKTEAAKKTLRKSTAKQTKKVKAKTKKAKAKISKTISKVKKKVSKATSHKKKPTSKAAKAVRKVTGKSKAKKAASKAG